MSKVSFAETGVTPEYSLDKDYRRGKLYFSLMEFDLSLASFNEFLSREEGMKKEETLVTAKIYNHIALCYFYLFDYHNAYQYMKKSIKIKEKFLASDDRSLVISKLNLEDIFREIEKEEKRPSLRKRILAPFKYLLMLKYRIFSTKN